MMVMTVSTAEPRPWSLASPISGGEQRRRWMTCPPRAAGWLSIRNEDDSTPTRERERAIAGGGEPAGGGGGGGAISIMMPGITTLVRTWCRFGGRGTTAPSPAPAVQRRRRRRPAASVISPRRRHHPPVRLRPARVVDAPSTADSRFLGSACAPANPYHLSRDALCCCWCCLLLIICTILFWLISSWKSFHPRLALLFCQFVYFSQFRKYFNFRYPWRSQVTI